MSEEGERARLPPTDREEPVGEPVVRGDESVTGEHAKRAVAFDPEDPESVAQAARTARAFAEQTTGTEDSIYMLRGAAACAALVRAEGSYKAAAERAGGEVGVPFIRKWARVHDLPQAIRRHVATGEIPPTAAKHIARVGGEARYHLAWAVLDGDLTVREVRTVASAVNDGTPVRASLREHGVEPGRLEIDLPEGIYLELRRRAALEGVSAGEFIAERLDAE
ncbi:MAG: hypothetical protein ABEH77_06665 [Halobacteriaceae archaeon]